MIKGISHITLIVEDLAKSSHLFQTVFEAREVYSSDSRNFSLSKEKFLLVGGLWIALMEGSPIQRSYNHIAFEVEERQIPGLIARIKQLDLEILEGRQRYPEEGVSVYFYDYDNHLFELHTGTLDGRLAFYNQAFHHRGTETQRHRERT